MYAFEELGQDLFWLALIIELKVFRKFQALHGEFDNMQSSSIALSIIDNGGNFL